MAYKYLEVKDACASIAQITLKREEKRNALCLDLMEELTAAFEALAKQEAMRIVILQGTGSVFCAGLDLQESADHALVEKMAQHVARLLKTIYTSPLVTIAAVQGDAIAGGAGIVAACDYALLTKGARMGFPETKRGLVAAQVATLLCRQMRMRDVRELLLLGELVDSERAVAMGLANRQVDKDKLLPEAMRVAGLILQGAPTATKDTKRLLDNLDPANFFDDLEMALSFHQSARLSEEAKEGVAAFLEKRAPIWSHKAHAAIER